MTIEFCDGFEHYSNINEKNTAYSSPTLSTAYAKHGSYSLAIDGSLDAVSFSVGNRTTLFCAFFLYLDSTYALNFISFYEGSSVHVLLKLSSNYTLVAYRSTTLLGSSVIPVPVNRWCHLEMKIVIHDTTGEVVIKLDGNTILNLTSVDTRNSGTGVIDAIRIGDTSGSGAYPMYVDDLVIWNTEGSVNNSWLGRMRVDTIYPDGAGNYNAWTPSTGSNYTCVDEARANGDTDYVYTSTATNKDTYTFGNISHDPSLIHATQTCIEAKYDTGTHTIREMCRQSSTDYTGTTKGVPSSYAIMREIREVDPNTTTAWTKTGIGTAEFGFELVS